MSEIVVFRYGHRPIRDFRVSTHLALTARAFGASRIVFTNYDSTVDKTLKDVNKRWGSDFHIEVEENWKHYFGDWKKNGGVIAHLTMYGISFLDVVEELKPAKKLLLVVGASKVPPGFYYLSDYNLSVGNQPHSEISSLAVLLYAIRGKKMLDHKPSHPECEIIPQERGKRVKWEQS